MRQFSILCLVIAPTIIFLSQPAAAQTPRGGQSFRKLQVKFGVDAGYQYTHYAAGFWTGDSGWYHGPAFATDLFLVKRMSPLSKLATGIRFSVGYGKGTGTFEDGESINPAGGSGDPSDEYSMKAWYLRGNALWVLASDIFWVGAGLGGRHQEEEIDTLGADDRWALEFVLAGGVEIPLGRNLSLTTKAEVNSNLIISTAVAGSAGLKLRF